MICYLCDAWRLGAPLSDMEHLPLDYPWPIALQIYVGRVLWLGAVALCSIVAITGCWAILTVGEVLFGS